MSAEASVAIQPRRLLPLLAALLVAAAQPAAAELIRDGQWRALLERGRLGELEQAARSRLAREPTDPEGVAALALTAVDFGDKPRLQTAIDAARRCTERRPQAAACHYALGTATATLALRAGAIKALAAAGRVREALARAVDLDPLLYEARNALVRFHLAAPALAGGSVDAARGLAQAAATRQPEHARVLRAMLALHDERLADAEAELAAVRSGSDHALAADVRQGLALVALQHLEAGRPDEARRIAARLRDEHPRQAIGAYALGRVAAEQGRLDEAIHHFERARGLDGAARLPIDLRLGRALQALGDRDRARQAFERFVAGDRERRVHPRHLDDAKKRLAELG